MATYYPIEFDTAGTSFRITNTGTGPSPCVITLVPKVNLLNITISGLSKEPIVITNIMANDVAIIDGEQRTFTVNGVEAWNQYSGWQFPHVEPGVNIVEINNGAQLDVEIAYDARFI